MRSDIAKKYEIYAEEVKGRFVGIRLQRRGSQMDVRIANIYIPPEGCNHYDPDETVQNLSAGANAAFLRSDFDWRFVEHMARFLWPDVEGKPLLAGHGGGKHTQDDRGAAYTSSSGCRKNVVGAEGRQRLV